MSTFFALLIGAACLLIYDGASNGRRAAGNGRFRLEPRVRKLLVASAVGATAAAILAVTISPTPLVAIPAMGVGGYLPWAMAQDSARRRAAAARAAWPDAISDLVAGIRAGVSLAEGIERLSERAPEPLIDGFGVFRIEYRATGNFARSMDAMRTAMADPTADRVVVALVAAQQVGGTDLVRVLNELTAQIRATDAMAREVEARWSWTITAARLAAAAPAVVLVLMLSRPEGAAAYATPTGGAVIVGAAIATVLGYRLMLRAARMPQERRLP